MSALRPLRAVFAVLWMVATLWRATGASCVHHAPADESQQHVAADGGAHEHHAMATLAQEAPHDRPPTPCDCADDCCGAASFIAPLPIGADTESAPRSAGARIRADRTPLAEATQLRLPPSTAPPSSLR
jgi:hypothetical protein